MKNIKYYGYLIQEKLEEILSTIIPKENWIGREVAQKLKGGGKTFRWDMMFTINDITYVVEFDGDRHYRESSVILRDRMKDSIANDNGYRVVRIPYFVQLTTETLMYYFNDLDCSDITISQDFPHGFITSKMFPADYCHLGHNRFIREMILLPTDVRDSIMNSIDERIKEHGWERVVCPTTISDINSYA